MKQPIHCFNVFLQTFFFLVIFSFSGQLKAQCEDYIQSPPNEFLSLSIELDRKIAASEDFVNVNFVAFNNGDKPLADIQLDPSFNLHNDEDLNVSLQPIFSGDPNNNGQLDPGERWYYSAVISVPSFKGRAFVVKCGARAQSPCGYEIGGSADLLFNLGLNMDVEFGQECIDVGGIIDVTLVTRLLVDEDAAKNPGTITIIVGGVPIIIPLAATRWEARDLMITDENLNGGITFDPFNPPAGLGLTNFCEQGGADAGRNTGNVLDECEPIDTVREPCSMFGEDDTLCEYPDWVFCYELQDESDGSVPICDPGCILLPNFVRVTAADEFSVWFSEENPPGSGVFGDFTNISAMIDNGGSDTDSILVKHSYILITIPVDFIFFSAEREIQSSVLSWATASELNNSHFEIERRIGDGPFEVIGRVKGNGTTTREIEYNFTDDRPGKGLNYYRLAQYDYDGSSTYSDIVSLDFSSEDLRTDINVYPNPAVDYIYVDTSFEIGEMRVQVYSTAGKIVLETQISSDNPLDISGLAPGLYSLSVSDAAGSLLSTKQVSIVK